MKRDLEGQIDPPELTNLVTVARRQARHATPEQMRRGWAAVSTRVAAHKARKRGIVRLSMVAAVVCAFVLLVVGADHWIRPMTQGAIGYHIQGGSIVEGGYLREAGNSAVKLLFTDGSEFVLRPGTRGRLRHVDSKGARIAIEHGAASFQVTPRKDARWLVDVGPFLVTVKGTVFTVAWDVASERFELRLQHGNVSVSGPVAGGEIPLRAGQRLVVNLPKDEIIISEQQPEEVWPGSAPAASQEMATTPGTAITAPVMEPSIGGGQGLLGSSSPSPVGRTVAKRKWAEASASGDWGQILADVDRIGEQRLLAEASSEELLILADAARYRGRIGLARSALLSERARFSSSPHALDATFLLGRLEEMNPGGVRKAIEWYVEYLNRAPSGTYASEALGRKMIATSKLEGVLRAKPMADEYLLRFPRGTYAGAARALQQAP